MEYMPEYYALNLEKSSSVSSKKKNLLTSKKSFTMFYILKNENNFEESFKQIFSKSISRNIDIDENEKVKTNRIRTDLTSLLKHKPDSFVLFNVTQTKN
jgi:hypothetical protein